MSDTRRVTFVTTDLFPGGSPRVLATVSQGLAARGFDVDVVSLDAIGEVGEQLRTRGIPVSSLRTGMKRDLRMLPRLISHIRARRPAVVCSVLVHANILAAFARPHIKEPTAWIHSLHTLQEKPRWHWPASALAMGMADGMIVPSRAILRKLEGRGMVPRPRVIPNGIDIPRFTHACAIPADEQPWPAGARVVGYLGRFDPVKRLPLLLHAMRFLLDGAGGKATGAPWALVDRLHLAMIGWGRQEYELRRLAAELRLMRRVHFIKPTAVPERWYKTFDVFCLPSRVEGYPLSVVEALAAGTKAVLCDAPGVTEAVGEGSSRVAWVSAEPTAEELAVSLLEVLAKPQLAPISDAWLGEHSADRMIEGYEEYLDQMAGVAGAYDRV